MAAVPNASRNTKSGRIRVRSRSETDRAEAAEVTVNQASFEALRQDKAALRKLLVCYADARIKAERSGRPVEMTIQVHPDRAEPGVQERPVEGDALDRALVAARARGNARVAEILRSPDMLTAREFGTLIGASHETINQKRKAGEVLGLEGATRGFRYPAWQMTEDGQPLPGLAELAKVLQGGPWTLYRFLVQPHDELGGKTGRDALAARRVDQALDVARGIAQGTFA